MSGPGREPAIPAIPGYRIEKAIGQGAQGQVLLAVREADGRRVAIKLLLDAEVGDYRDRFSREATTLLRLEDPHVVAALDVGRAGTQPYVVMEYVEGETLFDRLDRGPLPEAEALAILRQATEGLAYIHAQGVVHRDLKPENVMITRAGVVKLMDLGLAKVLDAKDVLTATGSVFGTPGYISPEAALDTKRADIRSDVYGLGATLYHALTGHMPFQGKSAGALLRKVLTETPIPVRQRNPAISAATEALVTQMMDREPDRRPQTPQALLIALDAAARGEMPPAPPPPPRRGFRLWPFGKR